MTSANFFKKIGLFAKMTYLNIKNRNRLHFVMDEQARIDALLKKYPENSSLLAKKEVITDYERDFIFDELISALKTKKFENLDILTRGLDLSDIKELLSKYELTSTKTEKGKGLLLKTLERSIARTESIAPVVIPGPDVHKFKRRTEIVPDLVDPDSDKKPDTDPKPEDKPEKKPEDKPAVIETFGKDDYVTYIIRDGESVETVCTFYCRKNIKGQFNLFDIQIDPATNSASYNGRPCVIIADNIRKKATIQFADGSTETIISQAIKTTIDGVVKQLEFLTTKPQLFAKAKRSRFLKKGVEPQGIYSDKTIESLISAYYDSIMSVSNPQVTGAVKNLHFDVQRAIDEVHLTGPKTPESSTT